MTGHRPLRRGIVGGLVVGGLIAAGLGGRPTATRAQDRPAEGRVESNVVYAMYSGLALLTDVYHPARPNGYGIIRINGSAWYAPRGHSNFSLKDVPGTQAGAKPLLDAGYTVFQINHRAAPEFKHPAAQEDAQRAVRFVRANAGKYGIRPDRIGATGGSSGGHLALLLGVLDGAGVPDDPDPVARESAKAQCVVAWMAPGDLLNGYGGGRPAGPVRPAGPARPGGPARPAGGVQQYLGTPRGAPDSPEAKLYREASPVTHVTTDAAPTLLVHGDADPVVPIKHSELMEDALKKAGVPVKLVRLPGGGHGPGFRFAGFREEKDWPDYQAETVRWFDQHLRKK